MIYDNDRSLHIILNSLFSRYQEYVPDVRKITGALIENEVVRKQADMVNDHIAFRSFGVDHLGIESLEKIFLQHGYTKRDAYNFETKKLNAYWYAPPAAVYPRVFISELRVKELSVQAQDIILKYTSGITEDPLAQINLDDGLAVSEFLHSPLWDIPTKQQYNLLLNESEYAAWVIYNRYYLNHYTISVHELPAGYNTLVEFNEFLESIGIVLNTAGGKIKVSDDGLLLQSSSVAAMQNVRFACGSEAEISGSYVEFAERKVLPGFEHLPRLKIRAEHRREGFEASNADKIFESTYTEQTKRKS